MAQRIKSEIRKTKSETNSNDLNSKNCLEYLNLDII